MDTVMWINFAYFALGIAAMAVCTIVAHLVRLPLVEVSMAALLRHKIKAAEKKLAAQSDSGAVDELDMVGKITKVDPRTGKTIIT